MTIVSPSVLSADFLNLGEQIRELKMRKKQLEAEEEGNRLNEKHHRED